ncbi:MAG: hypothetical protein K9K66_08490 [Desulfarculaceae bacterium]|nr:hypothetical protein [Desulfarculaceae bacterium]MCF8071358.1 hypothetical protein [Desulfarculaceae bacterium]MCF8101683.1 hypothetical protein [Desulfarculaceae bacterium]MCF8116708.1 hypothetical protein [Desulfarculaceae bacterium]
MDHNQDQLRRLSLDFLAQVTANATHEIKNELAVMNEQSHLLQEFLEMAAKGRQVDPERLHTLVERIIARVGQADEVVKRLNAFAHSADLKPGALRADGLLPLTLEMFARRASLLGVSVEAEGGDVELPTGVDMFLLEAAMWYCLVNASEAAGKGQVLKAGLEKGPEGLVFWLKGDFAQEPAPPEAAILESLGASFSAGQNEVRLSLSK